MQECEAAEVNCFDVKSGESHRDGKDANCTATVKYFSGMKELGKPPPPGKKKKKRKKKFTITKTTYVLKVDWKSNSANMADDTIFFFPFMILVMESLTVIMLVSSYQHVNVGLMNQSCPFYT